MADEGRNIEEIAADLRDTRQKLVEAQAEAAKGAAYQREQERLTQQLDRKSEQLKKTQAQAGELETALADAERRLRGQAELEREVEAAVEARDLARGELEAAQEALTSAQSQLAEQQYKQGEAEKEIERLQGHAEQTDLFNQAVNKAKELG